MGGVLTNQDFILLDAFGRQSAKKVSRIISLLVGLSILGLSMIRSKFWEQIFWKNIKMNSV